MAKLLIVNPDDVNLADVKAMAAKHDANVISNPYVPRRTAFLVTDPKEFGLNG